MLKLIKKANIYSPDYIGERDILIAKDTIINIASNIQIPDPSFCKVDIIDASGKIVVPGFIDLHVHLIGGGGEGGFKTRTPEIQLSSFLKAGITTAVGCIGTDSTSRHLTTLLAKARGLEEEGISTYIYTGSYQFPLQTITGNCRDDIILIEKVLGVGEVAIADHRSSQPSAEEFRKMAAYARVGGLLANKAGIVHVHMGEGLEGFGFLLDLIENTELSITQFLPTHINRNKHLLKESIEYVQRNGVIDLTTSSVSNIDDPDLSAGRSLGFLLDNGVPISALTFSSDGNGSLPIVDDNGKIEGLGIGSVSTLFNEVKKAVLENELEFATVLKLITSNPAERLRLLDRGRIEVGKRADLVFLSKKLDISSIISGGKFMMEEGKLIHKGTFE